MKDKLILLGFLIFSVPTCHAKPFQVGAEAGFTTSLGKISYVSAFSSLNKIATFGLRLGARFGLPIQYQMSKNKALYSGFYYAMKGNSREDNNGINTIGLVYNSIEIPLALVYTTNKQDASNFFIGGGGYLGYAISGKIQSLDINGQQISKNVRFGNEIFVNDMRRLDYGLHFQTGWSFQNGLLFRIVA